MPNLESRESYQNCKYSERIYIFWAAALAREIGSFLYSASSPSHRACGRITAGAFQGYFLKSNLARAREGYISRRAVRLYRNEKLPNFNGNVPPLLSIAAHDVGAIAIVVAMRRV